MLSGANGKCEFKFSSKCKYLVDSVGDVKAGPFAAAQAKEKVAGKGQTVMSVDDLMRLRARLYLDSPEALKHYGRDISHGLRELLLLFCVPPSPSLRKL